MKLTGVVLLALLIGLAPAPATAQDGPPQFVRDAVDAVLAMLNSDGDAALETFIDQSMPPAPDRDRPALMQRLRTLRNELRGLGDGIAVEGEPDGVRLMLAGRGVEKQLKVTLGPEGVSDLQLLAPVERMELTRDNLAATFDEAETEGLAGLAYVRLDGEVVLERAFGMANEALGVRNTLDTIFGIGSRPIDFTMAAIYLLAQRGQVSLDDTIDQHFENVPADKKAMTLRHLMTGRSGLPDFFHTSEDWDADLAWVDRETAERRLLYQELLFSPGEGREHSHGAFGLLAAVIERVTGKAYYDFLRESFFDPEGMTRTGENGETRGLSVSDFAVGGGPQRIGLPNIPPNWGPTSWLVKGSGGMYSTLGDLQKFYAYVRSGEVLDEQHSAAFRRATVSLDGSDRGFELFSSYQSPGNEAYLFLNAQGNRQQMRQLFRALERLVEK